MMVNVKQLVFFLKKKKSKNKTQNFHEISKKFFRFLVENFYFFYFYVLFIYFPNLIILRLCRHKDNVKLANEFLGFSLCGREEHKY